ncbi:MAG TPA: glycosyltransferase [Thermoleophilaceae bacterium]|nr:glycosyltransferase [Thermoleophilaceae bacterium]
MPTLLAASTGGHLDELIRLRPRLGDLGHDVVWATSDTPQSRSRLKGERVVFSPPIEPRDYRALTRSLRPARNTLQENEISAVVSTGSGIALTYMPLARARSIPCHYVESAARSEGPSLTGRILSRVHGVNLYTQYAGWATGDWRYAGSVFDGFAQAPSRDHTQLQKVVVTLGTIKSYGFEELVERLLSILPAGAEVLWQTGSTDVSRYPIDGRPAMPAHEMDEAMRAADVVVAHAGVGSSLAAVQSGHAPLLVPRRGHRGEHVDDHQQLIAAELARRDLAVAREVDELTLDDLERAARGRVQRTASPPPLELAA